MSALVGGAIILAVRLSRHETTYLNKPLSKWFYGERNDFFLESTRNRAGVAFQSMGTNAFPFLLANLEARGNSSPYFRLHRALPKVIQAHVPYPISGDDIQMMALALFEGRQDLPPEGLAALVKEVPKLRNPRVRLRGLGVVQRLLGRQADWPPVPLVSLGKVLLDDEDESVRQEASLLLADINSEERRSYPILLSALGNKEKLRALASANSYIFGQPPGGSGNGSPPPYRGHGLMDREEMERSRIIQALERVEPRLDEQQQTLLREYRRAKPGP